MESEAEGYSTGWRDLELPSLDNSPTLLRELVACIGGKKAPDYALSHDLDVQETLFAGCGIKDGKAFYINRSTIKEVQTPQSFKKKLILNILSNNLEATDEIGMVLKKFPRVQLEFVKGEKINYKLTTEMDFQMALQILDTQSI